MSIGTVGVVIRTLNESELIGCCIETLHRQRGGFELDILVVDSGSTDSTLEIARDRGARILELAPTEFDYSKALNVGIEQVGGDVIVSLSAHAIPADEHVIERLTAPFDDPIVAGVAARQLPWPDAPWQEVHRLQQQFTRSPRVYSCDGRDDILFSNAASCIRRSAWSAEPFTLPAVEDLEWARRVVAAGWIVVYEPRAAIYHSHDENPREQAHRLIDINRAHDDPTGPRTPLRTLREALRLLVCDSRAILGLDEPVQRKLAHLISLMSMVCFYVADFSSTGTTAERRLATDQRTNADLET